MFGLMGTNGYFCEKYWFYGRDNFIGLYVLWNRKRCYQNQVIYRFSFRGKSNGNVYSTL